MEIVFQNHDAPISDHMRRRAEQALRKVARRANRVVDGKVDTVVSRGTVVIENDAYTGRKGHGQFVRRGLSQYLV